MNKKAYFFSIFLSAILGGLVALGLFLIISEKDTVNFASIKQQQQIKLASLFSDTSFIIPDGINFVFAAETVVPTVVHIKSSYSGRGGFFHNPFEEFFDMQPESPMERRGLGYGSGVIISEDGYIVTNQHVIDQAEHLEVTFFNGKKVKATLVGEDPTTDLALLKINGENLPFVTFGNSDQLKIGEWVLAIGNPYAHGRSYDLTSTVTAGIVSAKGRNIGILRDSLRIESFIQTDAAVNPGNSGGALINLKGELIGINTAIASPTGSFSGYSFAVPASIVRKVMNDLLEFGAVQRALLGVSISEVDINVEDVVNFDLNNGVFVDGVARDGAAQKAGLKSRDVIISINNVPVNSVPQLQELIAQKRPGDNVEVKVLRKGEVISLNASLKSARGDDHEIAMEPLQPSSGK